MTVAPGNHAKTDQDHRDAQHLPHGQPAKRQVTELSVGYANEFDNEAEDAVAHGEQAGHRHGRPRFARVEPENDEQGHAFQGELVELRRVPRQLLRIGREDHRPRHIGRLAPEFGIDEITDAPGAQPNGDKGGNEVHQLEKFLAVAPRKDPGTQQHAQQTAMKRHATLPNLEDQRRIVDIGRQIVEQHIAQPPADDHAHGHPEHQVGKLVLVPNGIEAVQPTRCQQPGTADADQVHQAIPVDLQRAKRHGHRVYLRIRQHPDFPQIKKLIPTPNSSSANRRRSIDADNRCARLAPTRAKNMLVMATPTSAGK